MTYAKQLNRVSYELVFSRPGVPRHAVVSRRNDERSRASIDAFLRVLDNADELECIASQAETSGGFRVTVTEVHTERSATLSFTYSGREYSARVVLGAKEQLSVKVGADAAAKALLDYLKGQETKKHKTRSIPILAVSDDEDKYAHLAQRFDLD
jgi:hypothetical protein